MIYRTLGEHTNDYSDDVIDKDIINFRGRHGRDRMAVGFTISAYHH